MRRQLNAPTCGSASWLDTRPQTETATPNASLANELRMSANCRPDISRRAVITPHDGIRITAAHNAFPATFTEAENNGYLDSILTANSPDALRILCEQRSMEENKRWRNWWNLHPGLRKWRYTIQPQNTSTGLRMHEDEIENLKHERLSAYRELVTTDAERKRNRELRKDINKRLYELTGDHVYTFGK